MGRVYLSHTHNLVIVPVEWRLGVWRMENGDEVRMMDGWVVMRVECGREVMMRFVWT